MKCKISFIKEELQEVEFDLNNFHFDFGGTNPGIMFRSPKNGKLYKIYPNKYCDEYRNRPNTNLAKVANGEILFNCKVIIEELNH